MLESFTKVLTKNGAPQFLTTQGINFHLEEMFKTAQEKIMLVAPYIEINSRLKEILVERKNAGVIIIVICRKEQLKYDISDIATEIIDRKSLHAKCYMTEARAVITSMNIITFSQVNNDEIGFFVSYEKNRDLYIEISNEMQRLYRMGRQQKSNIIQKKYSQQDNMLHVGRKYTQDELDSIFDFIYKKSAGIKETRKGDLVLFCSSCNEKYKNEEKDGILYYQGQNTGGEEQQLIYGNKILYDCFKQQKITIFLFKDYIYCGEQTVCQQPFKKEGKWIFPLHARILK